MFLKVKTLNFAWHVNGAAILDSSSIKRKDPMENQYVLLMVQKSC